MDHNLNDSLVALERLLEEFFNPLTSNLRKHEIELTFESFKNTQNSHKLCVYFVTNTSSQYVTMFALSTLENVIYKQWANISVPDKDCIKSVLHNYLLEKGTTTPHYLRAKYAKLLVDIAKHEWPYLDPNFFNNILELLKSEPNHLIGLVLLRTTSEEFMGVHNCFTSNRKEEITRLLQPYIPVIFDLLTNILENLGTKPRHLSTATPPPSPTHPSSQPNLNHHLETATFKPDSKVLIKEALETVQHLFTWVGVEQIPVKLIGAIFNFTSNIQDDDDTCVLAMSTINEIFYRKCVPPGSQDFFKQIFHHTVALLKEIVHSPTYKIETLDPLFVEKLSELLVLLIEQHLWRFELEPTFSAMEFLSLLFQLTMQLTSTQCYLRCAAIWAAFLKQIKPENPHKYAVVLQQLVVTLLGKIQFTYNSQLSLIDNSELNCDNETEWQIFLKATIEILVMVAEFFPLDTINMAMLPWDTSQHWYRGLELTVDHKHGTLNYEALKNLNYELYKTDNLCYILKDFSTLTQTVARLCSVIIENTEILNSSPHALTSFVSKLLESGALATSASFYNLKTGDSRLTEAFIDVHSEILAALKTILIWMTRESKLNNRDLEILLDISLPVLQRATNVPAKIAYSAAHLFFTITNIVSFSDLVAFPSVPQFVLMAPSLKFAESETMFVVFNAISTLLFKPWRDMNEVESGKRTALVDNFFNALTKEFTDLPRNTPEVKVREVANKLFPVLTHIVESLKDFPMNSKKMLNSVIMNTFCHASTICRNSIYTDEPGSYEQFFLTVFGVLQPECLKKHLEAFLQEGFDGQNANLSGVDSVLQMLNRVIETRSTAYKSLLPAILQFCMDITYPSVANRVNEHPEAYQSLVLLLYRILLHRWQYFYMSQVRLGYSPGCSEMEAGPDSPQKPEQLLAVLNVFGQALEQSDINIFRSSLLALEDLNNKWKLYQKNIFRQTLAYNFLNVLIKTLIDKSKDLLAEDIQVAVFNIASVDLGLFFKFLEHLVESMEVIDAQQGHILLQNFVYNHDKDMPTFVNQLQRFVNDVRQYRLCHRT
ncbi:unnamed protein product [Brassicogethes aeneus]|uniref:Uncharacterized protein n=1 Tax=Brassicogethes aeneus TaxID=1431903 RepID=A0A9P0FPY9_BRAAE|nr:unnamed protein product [Brassicogethes aeneus]